MSVFAVDLRAELQAPGGIVRPRPAGRKGSAEEALDEYEVETSPFSYLELLLARERYEFDAFHAATAETRGMDVLPSEKDYGDIEVSRVPLESTDEE